MASSLENNSPFDVSFLDDFSCKICLEILQQPMQCRSNEHYFCSECITKHLTNNSQTCPLCLEELTLGTLRPAPRLIANIVSQFKIPRCDYVGRGCKDDVKVEELVFHHKVCGFAPVLCSNEGCTETVNRQDKESHEKERCKFRQTKCQTCDEEMVHRDYEVHRCLLRKDIDEMKVCLVEITERLKDMQEVQKAHAQYIKDLQDPLRNPSSAVVRQERTIVLNGQIVVAGGDSTKAAKSHEIFNWATKSWTLFEDSLFFKRHHSFSFLLEKKIMLCGGRHTKRSEYLDISVNPRSSFAYPASLPNDSMGKGALYGWRVFTFGNNVCELYLNPSMSSIFGKNELHLDYYREFYGVECFDETIVAVGGNKGMTSKLMMSNSVTAYDVAKNEIKELAPLPYKVAKMATVCRKDNMIIIGGEDERCRPLNSVLMYNTKTEVCERLPSMVRPRSGCAAVIMKDVIVVMGGRSVNLVGESSVSVALRTVEYYVMGQDTWKELPAMHLAREGPTACIHV